MREQYFEYICDLIGGQGKYSDLLRYLFYTEFEYQIPRDGNREADGIDLRYQFGYANRIPSAQIASELDIYPCSVLEMMIALSLRVNSIVSNFNEDAEFIFSSMIQSLHLDGQTDGNFNREYCDERMYIFLNREYESDGDGGLVTLNDPPRDLRGAEIWDQVLWWLDEM